MTTEPDISHAVRRTVGIATLRRLHRMIDAEKTAEERDGRVARWLLIGCAFAALLVVAWMAFR